MDTQNSEENAGEDDPLGPNCYYDKSKSFFDNISCDDSRYGPTLMRNWQAVCGLGVWVASC